jgi:cytoskeleton protein RodZ
VDTLTEASGVGARLRQAREAQGLAIDDVAQQLKFAPRQIESLEQERFDRLPGPTIARGMVRNYARLLRIDPEPLIERMAPQAEKVPDPGQLAERFRREVPFSDGGKRSTLLYAGFSVGILVLVAALAYEWQQERAAPQFVAPAREPSAEPAPAPAPVEEKKLEVIAAPAPAEKPAAKLLEKPAAAPLEKPAVAAVEKPAVAAVEKPAVAAVEKPAVAAVEKAAVAAVEKPAAAAGTQRIVVRAEEDAWIEIRDASGRTLIATLAPAGSERTVQGRAPFDLVIGNAASVRLTYEGKPVDLRPHTRVHVARLKLR